ncbi:membrane protein [Enterococcus quebecensis]|nr:membrane protein [Enterococcus quebecensis]
MNSEVLLGEKLLEVLYILMGLILIYTGIKNLLDKTNQHRYGTAYFWCALGIVIGGGRFIPSMISGILIFSMTLPAIFKKVGKGKSKLPSKEYMQQMSDKLGMKIFVPALSIGVFAIIFALFTKLGALVGVGIGVLVAILILMFYSKNNKPTTFLDDAADMLGTVGPLSMLPMLLASLGAVFTSAGVGTVISSAVSTVVPKGNVTIGIIIYALGMMAFTIIMGNAFAAITVMTVGIGAPFVFAYGANPALIGMLALTCGYCGTLLTPMAANFNVVPVAMLEMKDKYGVIKNQWFIAIFMLVFQIVYMILFK